MYYLYCELDWLTCQDKVHGISLLSEIFIKYALVLFMPMNGILCLQVSVALS